MSRSRLNQLNELLQETMDQISEIASENPNIVVYQDYDAQGKLQWGEPIQSVCQMFDGRLGFFRKQLRKAASQIKRKPIK